MNKTRSDSLLSQLTEEQQDQIYDWLLVLGYAETLKKLAQPPPDGFGLETHRASLHRFFKRYQKMVRSEDVIAAKENRSNPQDGSILVSDAEQSFFHTGHQIATGPMTTDDFAKVSRWLEWHKGEQTKLQYFDLAHRQVALGERRHAFDREKYELNVARLALKHAGALQRINGTIGLDTQARLREARNILYGIKENSCRENPPGSSPTHAPDGGQSSDRSAPDERTAHKVQEASPETPHS